MCVIYWIIFTITSCLDSDTACIIEEKWDAFSTKEDRMPALLGKQMQSWKNIHGKYGCCIIYMVL
jgi:hypothetical protein